MLTAFYDFSVSPPSFDFVNFLVLAEVERRRLDATGVHVVFVPDKNDGLGSSALYDEKQKLWRLSNLLAPACNLLPSCRQVTICATRAEAAKLLAIKPRQIFPNDYSTDNPLSRWHHGWIMLASAMGETVQVLQSSAQAREYIASWVSARGDGRRPVNLVLRSASFNLGKNSNQDQWAAFAAKLNECGYWPVLVPDIEDALLPQSNLFEGITSIPEVAFNLDLRMALYEAANLNVMVTNGTAQLCNFNKKTPLLNFIGETYRTDAEHWERDSAVGFGNTPGYFNRSQRFIWRTDTAENLMGEFVRLTQHIDKQRDDDFSGRKQDTSPKNQGPPVRLLERFAKSRRWDQFDATVDFMTSVEQLNPEAYRLIGHAEVTKEDLHGQGSRPKAESAFSMAVDLIRKANVGRPLSLNNAVISADCLRMLGNIPEAIDTLRDTIFRYPSASEPYLLLARLQIANSNFSEASDICRTAFDSDAGSTELRLTWADSLVKDGREQQARATLRLLIDEAADDPRPYIQLGLLLEGSGELSDAADLYYSAVKRGHHATQIIYRLGTVLRQLDRLNEAADCLGFLIDNKLTSPDGYRIAGGGKIYRDLIEIYDQLNLPEKARQTKLLSERAGAL